MDAGHNGEIPKGLADWLASIERKLDEVLDRRREGDAGSHDLPRARSSRAVSPSDADPTLAGVPPSKFKRTPYFQVGRGVLRDGRNGPVMATNVLKGADRKILAHLLIHGSIHVAHVIAYRVNDDLGSIRERKRNAEVAIAKIKRAVRGILTIGKKDDCHSLVWVVERNEATRVEFSVELALLRAERARQELDDNKPCAALTGALDAIDEDDCIQLAHEVVCLAALMVGTGLPLDEFRVWKSALVLEKRMTQLSRIREIIRRSVPLIDDEDVEKEFREIDVGFSEERQRLESARGRATERFGDPYGQALPNDRVANETIAQWRREDLSLDKTRNHPLAETVLGHPSVERLRNKAEKRARDEKELDPQEVRLTVNNIVFVKALDGRIPPRIRLICVHVAAEIKRTLWTSCWDSIEGRAARALRKAKVAFWTEYERDPSPEELAEKLGWTVERVKEIEAWIRLQGPDPLDCGERQEPD